MLRRNRPSSLGALDGLYACLDRLRVEIEELERGGAQFSSKEMVRAMIEELKFLAGAYQGVCEEYQMECQRRAEMLNGCLNGVLLCKDLRYELCALCDLYVQTSEKFYL